MNPNLVEMKIRRSAEMEKTERSSMLKDKYHSHARSLGQESENCLKVKTDF